MLGVKGYPARRSGMRNPHTPRVLVKSAQEIEKRGITLRDSAKEREKSPEEYQKIGVTQRGVCNGVKTLEL